jgi:MFS family permease
MPAPFLDQQSTVAPSGYDRFLVPPAALAVQVSIGQICAFSTFNLPLTRIIGISHAARDDWTLIEVGWIFPLAIAILGLSAAVFGRWVDRVGPRRSMFTAALCFSGGFIVSAVAIHFHRLWLLYLGYGVLGGCGLGIGYISPVATLLKWFPDRPGLASGMAIMGFGGGALIAAPLSVMLMEHFRTATSNGVVETFVTVGVIYFMYMMLGVSSVRVPAADWTPVASVSAKPRAGMAQSNRTAEAAWRTPQFWLLWGALCMNATAGSSLLNEAAPLLREVFSARLTAAAAAGFVALLGLGNMLGMFAWPAISDTIGRRNAYTLLFALGVILYAVVPSVGHTGSVALFIAVFAVIVSIYGGGFAIIPAYLQDMFGGAHVGAIHGRLLTAWSVAGTLGPALSKHIREYEIGIGVPQAQAYLVTMYLMCALLVVGLLCNLGIRAGRANPDHRAAHP